MKLSFTLWKQILCIHLDDSCEHLAKVRSRRTRSDANTTLASLGPDVSSQRLSTYTVFHRNVHPTHSAGVVLYPKAVVAS